MIDSKLLLLKERKKGRFIFIKKDNWIKDAYWGVQRMQMRFPPRNFLNAFDRRFRQTFEWMGGRGRRCGIQGLADVWTPIVF